MDQFYFEEGYLEASYFTVIREAAAAFTVTATQTAVVDIADATGYYIPDYIATGYFEAGGQVREADAAFTVTAAQTAVIERITQAQATVNVSATNVCTVTRIIDSAAAFTAAFAPTLIATAFKNHTAVLDSVSMMSVDAQANRSANVLLEHIADLNAMAAKTVDVNANLSHTVSAVITANTNSLAQVTATSTVTLTADALKFKFGESSLTATSSIFISRNTNGRPRSFSQVGSPSFDTTVKKFGSASLNFSNNNYVEYASTPDWTKLKTIDLWFYPLQGSGSYGVQSRLLHWFQNNDNFKAIDIFHNDVGASIFQISEFINGIERVKYSKFLTPSSYPNNNWIHVRVLDDGTDITVWLNGQKQTKTSGSYLNNSLALNLPVRVGEISFFGSRLDELLITKTIVTNSSVASFTPPSTPWTFTDQSNVLLLSHFDQNFVDDTSITHLLQASLSAVVSITAQANANTKQGAAGLSTAATLSAQGDKPASASAALASTSTLSAIIGSVKDSITLNAGVFTVTAQESRLRDASCAVTSAFSPTITVIATKGGDIALSSAFALTADANSFTDSTADIAAVFSVTAAVDGITRLGSADFSVTVDQTAVGGLLESVSVPITSAFAATITVIQIEGVVANLQSTFAVNSTVTRLPGIILTLPSNFTTSITAFNAVHDTEQNRIYSYDVWHFDSAGEQQPYDGDELVGNFSGEESKFGTDAVRLPQQQSGQANGGYPGYHEGATAAQAYVPGYFSTLPDFTVDFFIKISYTANEGFVIAVKEIFGPFLQLQINRQDSDNLGTYRLVKIDSNNNVLATVQGAGNNGGHTNPFQAGVYAGLANNWEHIAVQYKTGKAQLYVGGIFKGEFAYSGPFHQYVNFAVPQANCAIDELRIDSQTAYYSGNFTPPTVAYADPTPRFYGFKRNGYAILEPRVSLQAIGFSIVTLTTPATFSTTAVSTITANQTARPTANAAISSNLLINAGKNVEIGSDLASQSTISVNAVKVTRTSADLNAVAAQSTANDRIRTTTAAVATTATISVEAAKTTGFAVNVESAATQSVTGFRIQQGQASISALNSQLTAAFKNATGTVLLESVTQMQITAEKNAVGVIDISAEFAQSTETADSKTVRVSSAVAAEFTQSAEGLRIQPAGADVSAQFTQTTNTDQSKIARVTADFTATVTQTTQAQRLRDGIALQASLGTLSCSIDRLRQFNSNLSAVIYDFTASPTFIIRVTADFSAFNSQLTVGDVINLDPALTLRVRPESRLIKITQETRVRRILPETRVNIIED